MWLCNYSALEEFFLNLLFLLYSIFLFFSLFFIFVIIVKTSPLQRDYMPSTEAGKDLCLILRHHPGRFASSAVAFVQFILLA